MKTFCGQLTALCLFTALVVPGILGCGTGQSDDSTKAMVKAQRTLEMMQDRFEKAQKTIDAAATSLDRASNQLEQALNELRQVAPNEPGGQGAEDIELHSASDAKRLAENCDSDATAITIARLLSDLDAWTVSLEDEEPFRQCKLALAARLRTTVKKESAELQKAALAATSSRAASEYHSKAGGIIALYPLSDDSAALEEAAALASAQADVAARLEVIRRQRYNQWATGQIEKAINGYNEKKSYWSPKQENPELIKSLVAHLRSVDPILLEPAVLELYNYVIQLTKDSISEVDKIHLTVQLTDPKAERKTLGDL